MAVAGAVHVADLCHLPVPPCPVHALTGLNCPGCGATRLIQALTRGDLLGAFSHNPFAALVLLWLAGVWLHALSRPDAARRPHPARIKVVLLAIVVFTVARNLPGVQILGPAGW